MSTVWPTGLPTAIQVNGLSETPIDQFVENTVDVGSPKRRQRFSGAMGQIQGKMTLTAAQMLTFDAFFETTLAGGALPFQWIRPSNGDTVFMRFLSGKPVRNALSPNVWQLDFAVRFDPS